MDLTVLLGIGTLAETMERIGSREFNLWKLRFKRRINKQERQDYALAKIAKEVRSLRHPKPGDLMDDHFLVKYKEPDKTKKKTTKRDKKQARKEMKLKMAISKAAWYRAVGVSK